jgi:hypothetical protein
MNHDELTATLRAPGNYRCSPKALDTEIADRLDLYRTLLRRCEWRLPCSATRPDIEVLQRDIQDAIK